MKRFLARLLVVFCLFSLVACNLIGDDEGRDILNPYFTGKVLEKYENSCLLEVTDTGNGNFFVGEKLVARTNIKNCPDYDVGDSLRISFDGKVALSYPAQVLNVYIVSKVE
jgi:hypothetical protein